MYLDQEELKVILVPEESEVAVVKRYGNLLVI